MMNRQKEKNLFRGQSLLLLWVLVRARVSMQESQVELVSLRPLHWSHPMTPSHPQPVETSPLLPPNRLVHLGQLFQQQ